MIKMKLLSLVAVVALVSSCGETPNEKDKGHGGNFRVDNFDTGDTTDVDTVVGLCDGEPEKLPNTKQSGQVALSNLAIGENDDPSDIRVTSYLITYFPIDGGGALTPVEIITSDIVPGGANATINVEMVPLATKAEFNAFFVPSTTTTNKFTYRYELEYEFNGVNEFNTEVSTKGSTMLTLGNFNTCD